VLGNPCGAAGLDDFMLAHDNLHWKEGKVFQ
jgi:hypothetical protein